jgi:hypothetical protein
MKFKTLAFLAISSLFAISIANATPAKASSTDDASAISGVSVGTNSSSDITSGNNVGALPNDSNSNDDMSADTATGDDDY